MVLHLQASWPHSGQEGEEEPRGCGETIFFLGSLLFPIQGKKPSPEISAYFSLARTLITWLPLVAKKAGKVRCLNCAYNFPEQTEIQLVRTKVRKDTGKANILASATKLKKHLPEDPVNIGRRESWSQVVDGLAQVGKRGCLSHGRDVRAG